MKVPRKQASVAWLSRSDRKVRRTRGLSCDDASVNATTVTEKESPATETVAVATVSSNERPTSGSAKPKTGMFSAVSSDGRPNPTIRPRTIATPARKPKLERSASRPLFARSASEALPPMSATGAGPPAVKLGGRLHVAAGARSGARDGDVSTTCPSRSRRRRRGRSG